MLLNVMDLLSVVRGALLDRPCMVFQRMYVVKQCHRIMMNTILDCHGFNFRLLCH